MARINCAHRHASRHSRPAVVGVPHQKPPQPLTALADRVQFHHQAPRAKPPRAPGIACLGRLQPRCEYRYLRARWLANGALNLHTTTTASKAPTGRGTSASTASRANRWYGAARYRYSWAAASGAVPKLARALSNHSALSRPINRFLRRNSAKPGCPSHAR